MHDLIYMRTQKKNKKIQTQKQSKMLLYPELEHEEKEEIFFKKERKQK